MASSRGRWRLLALATAFLACATDAANLLVLTRDWTPTTCLDAAQGCSASYPDNFRVQRLALASDASRAPQTGCKGKGGLKANAIDKSEISREDFSCAWQNATGGLKSLQNSWRESWAEFGKCTLAAGAVAYLELGVGLDQRYPLPNDLPASVDFVALTQALAAGFKTQPFVECDGAQRLSSISLCFDTETKGGGPNLVSCPWAAPGECAGTLGVPRGSQGPSCAAYFKASPVNVSGLASAAPAPAPAADGTAGPAPAQAPAASPSEAPLPAGEEPTAAPAPAKPSVPPTLPASEPEPASAPGNQEPSPSGGGDGTSAPAPAPVGEGGAAAFAGSAAAGGAAAEPSGGTDSGSDSPSTGLKVGAVVAGIAGGVAIGSAACAGAWWVYQRKKRRAQAVVSSPATGGAHHHDPEKGCLTSSAESLSSWSSSDGAARRLDSKSSGSSSRALGSAGAIAGAKRGDSGGSKGTPPRRHPSQRQHRTSSGSASPGGTAGTPPRRTDSTSSRRSEGGTSVRRMDSGGSGFGSLGGSSKYAQPTGLGAAPAGPHTLARSGSGLGGSGSYVSLADELQVVMSAGSEGGGDNGSLHRTLSGARSPSKGPSGRFVPGPPVKALKYVQPVPAIRSPAKSPSGKLPSVHE